jgi:predicted TIM-barrel fold metal-dependent hydrolase
MAVSVETQRQEKAKDDSVVARGFIDCDLHNELDSPKDLYPYLSERWRRHVDRYGLRQYLGSGYPRFMGHREEARPPSGRQPGSEVAYTRSDFLDRYDVAYAVLNPLTPVGRLPNQELEAVLATAVNDWQVAEWLDPEPRLRASLIIPFDDPPRAVEEIERRAHDRRFVQVQFTGRPHEPMGRRKYWPIYEACAARGLHVASHAFMCGGNPITGVGWPSYYIEDHVGPSQAMQANLVSMVAEGVFERFPTLTLVSVENAFGWLPALMWRLDSAFELLADEVPHLQRKPSEYLREHVYLATQPMEEPARPAYFHQLFDFFAEFADRLMFASDYPHWDGDAPDGAFPVHLPADLEHKIRYENARRLYDLP